MKCETQNDSKYLWMQKIVRYDILLFDDDDGGVLPG